MLIDNIQDLSAKYLSKQSCFLLLLCARVAIGHAVWGWLLATLSSSVSQQLVAALATVYQEVSGGESVADLAELSLVDCDCDGWILTIRQSYNSSRTRSHTDNTAVTSRGWDSR